MTNQERLLHYLDDALAVEMALAVMLKDMVQEATDPAIRASLQEHSVVTQRHRESLEARIRALGGRPQALKGMAGRVVARLADAINAAHDDLDKSAQHLMEIFAAEHLEMAMYRSLEAFADAVGDGATADLAREHFRQERAAADGVWVLLPAVAADAANSTNAAPIPG